MKHSLTPFHTFHLPAKATQIIEFTTVEQLLSEWQKAFNAQLPILILGQGSNVLFLEDFDGVVLVNKLKGITHHEDEHFHYLHVQGGENWHELVKWTLAHNIAGIENLALIPGVASSAPIQNIGAYGVEFEQVCDFVEVLNLRSGELFKLSKSECEFGYRESVFKHQYRDEFAIISVGLKLAKAWKPVLSYGSLAQLNPETVTPIQIFDEVCAVRSSKLPNPDEFGNAGSFFKNPVISNEQFAPIQAKFPAIPHYPQADGTVKLAAGWLIDQTGLKDLQIGGAAVHTQQALVLINKENATGQDVLALAKTVRQRVKEKFGVEIQPEVRFIGKNGEVDSEKITR
ncbi:UDP-N-acetylmuramate dehydrogenase [Mannheimia haemolytica]|uniref:UDP-N-acetylenolpyruvoylglucosamine reductase n=2 Tax=Mannheimia haemolytica TaxID=75985 RepID=A0A547EGF4_MANHA|nr:UDP-N-acetylmuramate dehydrogenase [Mannheimia haemolytica USDA-ARS-USMARC-183]AGI34326.2 UDP-N-acetylmuramate dehydrogenase [Mannheimia haemolytica USDA-ARS-USMARC-185]AKA12769.1 UDP-N-acetylenolpyruvoylglucosamine reductase [Mannheimia haemolytica]AWW72792.1 UDP-N-acetylmuramate dehydrogenase [Pasteurellaceae bacterium 12565]EME04217.1 UDP-N-acetylenolpyruvoylglucosamine reductase [Mannheimia haemolytica serotype 6 str. H23]